MIESVAAGNILDPHLDPHFEDAVKDTIERFEETGSPIIHRWRAGEIPQLLDVTPSSDCPTPRPTDSGFRSQRHVRRMPRLTEGPFRYKRYAYQYLDVALKYAHRPLKQAVISPSALSLMYPADPIPGYSRDEFIEDLLSEHEKEVRGCLAKGAAKVQIDFTEARFAMKVDPTGELLSTFIDLNNLAMGRFSEAERKVIGVHTCPGGDLDSTHSAEVDYAEFLPLLFQLNVGYFCIALTGEKDRVRVLKIIREHMKPGQRVFAGVVSPIDPCIDTAEQVRDRVLEAAKYIPVEQLGTTDDCGFAPFSDDTSTSRDKAFAKFGTRRRHGTSLGSDCRRVVVDNDEKQLKLQFL